MKVVHILKSRHSFHITIFRNFGLALLGVVIALGLVELLLRVNPNLVPPEVRVNPPVRRVHAFQDETYDVSLSDGDLWYWLQGNIQPMRPNQDKVLARVHYTTDTNGFPNSPSEKSIYAIVTLGDSFTEGRNVAVPWPQKLSEYTNKDTLNLGQSAFGPQQELEALRQYGIKKQPQWVIMAYFEGNDLHDAAAFEQASPLIVLRLGKHLLSHNTANRNIRKQDKSGGSITKTNGILLSTNYTYQYPITVTIGDTRLEMAFFPNYIAWLSTSRQAIESSRNYHFTTETILQARELSEASGSHFLLVYIPSKPHVYLRYLPPEILTRALMNVQSVELNEAGFLEFTNQTATPELLRQHMDDQAVVLAEFAAEKNIAFLDLTPHFQAEAGTGAELYYTFDTHWNQHGNNLAAQVIAKYMRNVLGDKAK